WYSPDRIHNTPRIYDLIDNWVLQELFYDKLQNVSRTQPNIQVVTILGCALVALGFLLIRRLLSHSTLFGSRLTTSLPRNNIGLLPNHSITTSSNIRQTELSLSVSTLLIKAWSNPTFTRSVGSRSVPIATSSNEFRGTPKRADGRTPLHPLVCYLLQVGIRRSSRQRSTVKPSSLSGSNALLNQRHDSSRYREPY
ncbi:hypothetical protein C8J56DRAFT_1170088, partial [Mycena floridula]